MVFDIGTVLVKGLPLGGVGGWVGFWQCIDEVWVAFGTELDSFFSRMRRVKRDLRKTLEKIKCAAYFLLPLCLPFFWICV